MQMHTELTADLMDLELRWKTMEQRWTHDVVEQRWGQDRESLPAEDRSGSGGRWMPRLAVVAFLMATITAAGGGESSSPRSLDRSSSPDAAGVEDHTDFVASTQQL